MAVVSPSAEFRKELRQHGGESVARCFQCATCSAVCDLAPPDAPFPRRQMLLAQWGVKEQLISDPAIWLCHQCNDCTERCPRDARPGDVMASLRAAAVRELATPRAAGKLVGDAGTTWPILIGFPLLFWIVVLYFLHGLTVPSAPLEYHYFVPYGLIYIVFFSLVGVAGFFTYKSGKRFWNLLGQRAERKGSFWRALWQVAIEISFHKRFSNCGPAKERRWGHLALVWGFVGAAITSGLLVVLIYLFNPKGLGDPLVLDLKHPVKLLGNFSALLLVVGGAWLLVNRLRDTAQRKTGASTAFDNFFLAIVLLVIATGCLVEAGRFWFEPAWAVGLYIVHLASVFCLFVTFPYSKFAHLMYRTLAMVHERMAGNKRQGA